MSQDATATQALLARLWANHDPDGAAADTHRALHHHLRDDEAAALLDGDGDLGALVHVTVCAQCQELLLLADEPQPHAASADRARHVPAALVLEVGTESGVLALHSCSGVHRIRAVLTARRGAPEAVVSVRDHAVAGSVEVDLYADQAAGATAVVRWRGGVGPAPTTATLRGPGPGQHFATLEHGVASLPIAGPGRWTVQLWDDTDTLCATIVLGWRAPDEEPP